MNPFRSQNHHSNDVLFVHVVFFRILGAVVVLMQTEPWHRGKAWQSSEARVWISVGGHRHFFIKTSLQREPLGENSEITGSSYSSMFPSALWLPKMREDWLLTA